MQFHINDVLVFDDHAMLLALLADQKKCVKLGSVHSRCLAYICARATEQIDSFNESLVITWKELFYQGWEKYGLTSSKNGLAQAMFQLRKRLSDLGIRGTIKTIPRVGYRLIGFYIRRSIACSPPPDKPIMTRQDPTSSQSITLSSVDTLGSLAVNELVDLLCRSRGSSAPLLIIIKP